MPLPSHQALIDANNDLAHSNVALRKTLAAAQAENAKLRRDVAAWLFNVECPGIHLNDNHWSGCTAHDTGAVDCPTCGPLRETLASPSDTSALDAVRAQERERCAARLDTCAAEHTAESRRMDKKGQGEASLWLADAADGYEASAAEIRSLGKSGEGQTVSHDLGDYDLPEDQR